MLNNKHGKQRFTSKERILNCDIDRVRDELIRVQLDAEFYEQFVAKHSDDERPRDAFTEILTTSLKNAEMLRAREILLIDQLNFLKAKREDINTKKLMKDYDKFPKKINTSDMKEISTDELIQKHGVKGKLEKNK